MAGLPAEARELIESGALAHLVTLNPDGSPQVTCIWVGVEGHELVSAHLMPEQRKLQNVRREIERMGVVGPWAGR
jgi:nitroimidazol reductase NimA-like FMN-containing flavoprotein (pyridoxamine 5'-phosphate oxidase superfamily)